jgi:hypothetical protein
LISSVPSPAAVTKVSWQGSDSSLIRVICQLGDFVTLHKAPGGR